jgi:hypothetical protein
MASSSAPSSNIANITRDQQLLNVGRQCSHPSCHLVDFLPFKCQHCADAFCAEHFKPASHSCTKYDEAKYNRVAPDCEYRSSTFRFRLVQLRLCLGPLCNEPVPIPPGEDPNIRMERHLSVDCSVMTGRSKKANTTPRCARPKCGKLLFAQIQCDVSSFFRSRVPTDRLTLCISFAEMPSEVLPGTPFPKFTQLLFDLIDGVSSCKRRYQPEYSGSWN